MSIYYYLFNKNKKEGLFLGKKIGHEYQGPTVFVNGKFYFLPKECLELLIDRFKGNNQLDVIILPDYELLDSESYLSKDEGLIEVGGEKENDIPIINYLPELADEAFQKEIEQKGTVVSFPQK